MKNRWICLFMGLCVYGFPLESVEAAKPVVTNKQRFRIPFRFDAAALERMNARELQLFVSTNRGISWEMSQSITPAQGKFEFQAPADGEYWFAVRTIDGKGQAHPSNQTFDPGLMVIVDTIAPSLAVDLEQTPDGKVQLIWSASDANLDATTLRLEYAQPDQTGWQQVGVIPSNRGKTAWSLTTAGTVSVRGSISDLAGNVGQAKSELKANAVTRPRNNDRPDLRQPIAEFPAESIPGETPFPSPKTAHTPAPTAAPTPMPSLPTFADPAPRVAPFPQKSEIARSTPTPRPANAPTPAMPTLRPMAPSDGQFVSDAPQARPSVAQERWPAPEATADSPTNRSGSRQRVVNTRRFQLGYKLDDVGPSGVGGVELFITQDRGRQWFRYGEDPDRSSPFEVEVPQDGEYGFSVRVRSGAGLAIDPPSAGEPPSISVVVDQTPPRLELLPIQQGQGAALNQVLIRWKITEDQPADKPVSLYYAASAAGPWEPISGWRQDSGSFPWVVGPGAPSQLYFRVMARDAAGNVTKADTTTPIVVDLSRPSARIVDVEVLPSTAPRQ